MPPVIQSASLANISQEFLDISNQKEQDIWFDAIDYIEIEDTWFDASEEYQVSQSPYAREAADNWVPFTEDCRRGVQQFLRTLGEYGEGRMLSACISGFLPDTPTRLVLAANSLYTAITERRNIDALTVHALGLVSWYLPENNGVSRLATFIRDTIIGWTGETFLWHFLGDKENHTSIHLFTALAVTVIVAGRWMKDEGAPQRSVLKVPVFMANIFIRASHYWAALGNMAKSFPSGVEIPEYARLLQRIPAFEIDTQVEITNKKCDTTICGSSTAPRLSAFSSNSTVNPEAYTRATVQNRLTPTFGDNIHLSAPEKAHSLVMDKLRQENGLSNLLYCATRKTETCQQTNENVVTATHFNTKCDATVYPVPLWKAADMLTRHTDMPETQISSSATRQGREDALLSLVITGASVVPVAISYMGALKSKSIIAVGSILGAVGVTSGEKFLWNSFSSSKQIRNDDTQKLMLSESSKDVFQKDRHISNQEIIPSISGNVRASQDIADKVYIRFEKGNSFYRVHLNNKTTLIDFLAYKNIAILSGLSTEDLPPPEEDGVVFDFKNRCFLLKTQYGYIYISRPIFGSKEYVFLKTKYCWVNVSHDDDKKIIYLENICYALLYDIFPDEIKLIKEYEKIKGVLANQMRDSIIYSRSQNYLEIIVDFYMRIERRMAISIDKTLDEEFSHAKKTICSYVKTHFPPSISNSFDCALKYLIREPDFNNIDINTGVTSLIEDYFSEAGISNIEYKIKHDESIIEIRDKYFLFSRVNCFEGNIKNENSLSLRVKFYPGIGWAGHESFLSENSMEWVRGKYFSYLHGELEIIPELRQLINESIKSNTEHCYISFLNSFSNKLKKYIIDLESQENRERDQIAAFVILIETEEKRLLLNQSGSDNIVLHCINFFDGKINEKFRLLNESLIDRKLYDEAVATNFNEIKPFNSINKKISQVSEYVQDIKETIKRFRKFKNKAVNNVSLYTVVSARPYIVRDSSSALKERAEVQKKWDLKINERISKLKIVESALSSLKEEGNKQRKHFNIIKQVINEFELFEDSDKNKRILFSAYANILALKKSTKNDTNEEKLRNSYRILHYKTLDYFYEIYRLFIPNIQDGDTSWVKNKNILDIKEAKINARKIFERLYPNAPEDYVGYLFEFITYYILYKHDHNRNDYNPFDIIAYYNKKKDEYLRDVIFTDFTGQKKHSTLGDFIPGSFFTSRTEYTDQFNNYLDDNSVDFDTMTLSNLAVYNSDNLIVEDLVLPPKKVAYYKYTGGELKRHYKYNSSPVLGFFGVIECHSGNYLLIKCFSGYLQSHYMSAEKLKNELSLNDNNKFGFERDYSAIVSGEVFGEMLFIQADKNKKYESNLHREHYFQEFHEKKYRHLKDAVFQLIKKYLSYEVESLKESMDHRSEFTTIAGYIIPFYNELYNALTDSHHKFDTDSIIIDIFSIVNILTSAGVKVARLSSQLIKKITVSSLYHRNLGNSGFRLAELVLSDVERMNIPIKKFSTSEVKNIIKGLVDPIGITNHMKSGRESNFFNTLEKKYSPDFYANLHNFTKSSTGGINGYEFNTPSRMDTKKQWEVDYDNPPKEEIKKMDEINTGYFLEQKKNIFKSDEKYQGPGTSRSTSIKNSEISIIPINKITGETITRANLGKDFLLYSRKDTSSSANPVERVFITAHGEATILKRKFIIPDNSEIEFLTPHGSKMLSPGVDIINLPYFEPHSTIHNTGFSSGKVKPDGSPHTYTDDAKYITGISDPKPGEVRDYNLSFFDGDSENDIAEAINYNRDRRHPFVQKTDVVTVKNKLTHELIEPTLSNLIQELKKIGHPAKTMTVCICRESTFQKSFIYNPRRTKRDVSSTTNCIVDIYNYHINNEKFYLGSHWNSALDTGELI